MKYKSNNSPSEEERRKIRRAALFKMAAMGVFVAVVVIFGSLHMQIKQMTAETA